MFYSWNKLLIEEIQKEYFQNLMFFLEKEYSVKNCFPAKEFWFEAFKQCDYSKLKVVILGQDPYHKKGLATGLSFSVPNNAKIPSSLQNIFKEYESDLGYQKPNTGNLQKWANEGVLLLNTTLTVQENKAGSHQKKGWEIFTDTVISKISNEKENVVFILWGKHAQTKKVYINPHAHFIVEAPHPSGLSAYKGFWGSKPFTQTNHYLSLNNLETINWEL